MSLTRAKVMYYAVIAIPVTLLILIGGILDWLAAGALLVAAPLLLRVICQAAEQRGINDYRRLRRASARRILSTAQEEQDAREVGQ